MKKKVVLGFLGTKLDAGVTDKRWERWRPTVSIFGHENFPVDALELLVFGPQTTALEQVVVADIQSLRPQAQVRTHRLEVADFWNFEQVYAALHGFARGYAFDDDTDYYVHLSTGTHVAQICLFLLTEARYFPAKLLETGYSAQRDQGTPPWRGRLEVVDLELANHDLLARRFRQESQGQHALLKGGIATRNEAFNALISRIEKVALKSTAPLLLTGPTGAGKSALAKRVHELRHSRHLVRGPLVEVNCATLRGDNAMSALFGHKRGAFTGAVTERAGLLRAANGGTLFLDEVAELGLEEQAMLLRALESKQFTPMGSDREVTSDFQLLAGTNRNLQQEVAAGRFRADLLARINVWHFELPGLAQRPEDIEPNLDHELARASAQLGLNVTMSAPARQRFLDFARHAAWPGNFRDLSAAVARMATLAEGGRITPTDVDFEAQQLSASWAGLALPPGGPSEPASAQGASCALANRITQVLGARVHTLDRAELVVLKDVMAVIAQTDNMAEAGRVLFAQSRLQRSSCNDSDRVSKLLGRFGLKYVEVRQQLAPRAPSLASAQA